MRDDLMSEAGDASHVTTTPRETPAEFASDWAGGGPLAEEFASLPVTAPKLAAVRSTGAGQWVARFRGSLLVFSLVALCVICAPMQPGNADYLQAAAQARMVYRYDQALADYAQAHLVERADPQPLCESGDVYTLQQLPSAAVAAYRACAALAPDDGSAWLRLGDALATANDDKGAVSAWQRAGAAGDYTGYHRLAERAEGLGQLNEAARWWSQAPQDDETAQGQLGLLALAQGDVTAARAHFFSLSRSRSAFAAQLRTAGAFALAVRQPTTALDEENIGYALLTLGAPALALGPLRRATELAPSDGSAHAYYGWTLWQLGQRDAARPQIAAGLRYSPALPFALYAAGQVAMADGQFGLALARYQTALEITPKNPALWSAAGDAALAQADYVTAELSYSNAAQFSDDPAYTVALVRFYFTHGIGMNDGQALQVAFTALRRFPSSEPLAFIEGEIYDSLGQQTEAYYTFQRAVALDPSDPGPWFFLGRYSVASGDVIPAVVELRTALALRPDGSYAAQARQLLTRYEGYTL